VDMVIRLFGGRSPAGRAFGTRFFALNASTKRAQTKPQFLTRVSGLTRIPSPDRAVILLCRCSAEKI